MVSPILVKVMHAVRLLKSSAGKTRKCYRIKGCVCFLARLSLKKKTTTTLSQKASPVMIPAQGAEGSRGAGKEHWSGN